MTKTVAYSFALFLFVLLHICNSVSAQNVAEDETITISGSVTAYDGTPIDSAAARLIYSNFQDANIVYTDKNGHYTMPNVKKGTYKALYILRLNTYPRSSVPVPEDDMRLEFWGWNVIADRDMTIDAQYHRMELYGTNVFRVEGGYNAYMIYTRPMSLAKLVSYSDEIYNDKEKAEKVVNISVDPKQIEFEVFADDEPLTINMVQPVMEYSGVPENPMGGFVISVDSPKQKTDKPYIVFRVRGWNKEHDERGENVYFYEKKNYVKQK